MTNAQDHSGCPTEYVERYDSYYCDLHDVWLESDCTDALCVFCNARKERRIGNRGLDDTSDSKPDKSEYLIDVRDVWKMVFGKPTLKVGDIAIQVASFRLLKPELRCGSVCPENGNLFCSLPLNHQNEALFQECMAFGGHRLTNAGITIATWRD